MNDHADLSHVDKGIFFHISYQKIINNLFSDSMADQHKEFLISLIAISFILISCRTEGVGYRIGEV